MLGLRPRPNPKPNFNPTYGPSNNRPKQACTGHARPSSPRLGPNGLPSKTRPKHNSCPSLARPGGQLSRMQAYTQRMSPRARHARQTPLHAGFLLAQVITSPANISRLVCLPPSHHLLQLHSLALGTQTSPQQLPVPLMPYCLLFSTWRPRIQASSQLPRAPTNLHPHSLCPVIGWPSQSSSSAVSPSLFAPNGFRFAPTCLWLVTSGPWPRNNYFITSDSCSHPVVMVYYCTSLKQAPI